jgi:hypothetical protein
MNCPACGSVMDAPSLERMYGRRLTIDVCHHCQCLWFDDLEFLQMTPGATLELVASVAEDRSVSRGPWASAPRCPRCSRALAETHDLQRNTRFTYHRCPEGHGRLITYDQFLRAKNLVRPPNEAEVRELRARIRQINCGNCGAPVDVERNAVCSFCHSPLAIIDPDEIRKTIEQLRTAADGKKGVDATLPISLAMERLRGERAFAEPAARDLLFGDLSDPLTGFLRLLARLRN